MTSGINVKKLSQEESQDWQRKAAFLYWPMTMADIVNENDNATDSNVIGKVFSSYDDSAKFVEEYAK